MKAIAIIEIPDGGKGKWYIDGLIRYTEDESLMKKFDADMIPLKPMPEKKVVTVKRIEDIQSYSITEVADKISAKIILKTDEVFALGWNACLDSIIGENNESNISG